MGKDNEGDGDDCVLADASQVLYAVPGAVSKQVTCIPSFHSHGNSKRRVAFLPPF